MSRKKTILPSVSYVKAGQFSKRIHRVNERQNIGNWEDRTTPIRNVSLLTTRHRNSRKLSGNFIVWPCKRPVARLLCSSSLGRTRTLQNDFRLFHNERENISSWREQITWDHVTIRPTIETKVHAIRRLWQKSLAVPSDGHQSVYHIKSNMTLIMVDKPQPSYNLLNVLNIPPHHTLRHRIDIYILYWQKSYSHDGGLPQLLTNHSEAASLWLVSSPKQVVTLRLMRLFAVSGR